jgi:hypothetical protein
MRSLNLFDIRAAPEPLIQGDIRKTYCVRKGRDSIELVSSTGKWSLNWSSPDLHHLGRLRREVLSCSEVSRPSTLNEGPSIGSSVVLPSYS